MSQFNIFDLVPALSFDPPDGRRKAEQKIKDRIKEIEVLLRSETDSGKRKILEEEKSALDDLVNGSALTDERLKKDAGETRKKMVASLEAMIAVLAMSGKPKEITKGQIIAYKKQTRLDKESIEKTFKAQGFTIIETNKGKLPPLISDQDIHLIDDSINIIKNHNSNNIPVDLKIFEFEREKIEDLFWLIAFINKDISGGKSYSSKSREELYRIVSDNKNKFSKPANPFDHALLDLCTIGSTKIFDSDGHLRAYRNSLRYKQLGETFKIIAMAPESARRTAALAEPLIEQIQKHSFDYEESLAIYNKVAGLQNDPYEPEQINFTVKCGTCGNTQKFSSLGEAKKAKCSACGAYFYRPCPKCGEAVPSSAEYCPRESCGFFIAGIKNFSQYYDEAVGALSRFDIDEAQKYFAKAESANPNEPRLADLERKIKQAAAEYERPLKEIQGLIDKKELRAAQSKIADLHIKQPKLNLASFENQVKPKLAEADRLFASAASMTPVEKAKVCLKILMLCEDYTQAAAVLKTMPPAPCTGLEIKPDAASGTCAVSWLPSPDEGVTYTLVRKLKSIPENINDGTPLFNEKPFLDYQDRDIEPGVSYGYAVFAKRYGTVSKAVGGKTVLYSEISALNYETGENFCALTWVLPKNSIGVRITRRDGGPPAAGDTSAKVIAENTQRNFRDTNLVPGSRYGYRLESLYHGDSGIVKSAGITCSVLPKRKPLAVKISSTQDGDSVRISWQPVQDGFDLIFVSLNPDAVVQEGDVYTDDGIWTLGKILASERSDRGSAFISVKQGTYFEAVCFVAFSNSGIASNTISVNTFTPCELSGKPVLHNSDLCLSLKTPLPLGVKNIYYIVRKKLRESDPPPWAGPADVPQMTVISAEGYLRNNEIVIRGITEEGDYYITLLTGYHAGGRIVYADPVRKRFSNHVPGKINFGVMRTGLLSFLSPTPFKGGGALGRVRFELIVEFTASESVTELPAMALCYSRIGGMINSAHDRDAVNVYKIPKEQCRPGERITRSFPLNSTVIERMPAGRTFSLFVIDEDSTGDYRIGFTGKFSGTL
ncbi:MAG: zinc ribbon domain-containing protein [Treponema sp.]|jgi:tetratricopeptide (TPR) repeat protein|nr:zinc ribbon domain-containing protein [Treponema sp.]